MLNIGRGWLVPVTRLNIRRGRQREHPRTLPKGSRDLRSLRVLHNFRLRMRTSKRNRKGSKDLRSHPVAMLLLLRKKRGKKPDMRRTYFRLGPLPDRTSSGHVTLSLPVKRPYKGGYGATSGCACAEHTPGHGTWLTSLLVTELPVMRNGPIHANANWAVPIYYSYISIYFCRENDVRRNKIILFKNMYIYIYIYTNISLLLKIHLWCKSIV